MAGQRGCGVDSLELESSGRSGSGGADNGGSHVTSTRCLERQSASACSCSKGSNAAMPWIGQMDPRSRGAVTSSERARESLARGVQVACVHSAESA